MPHQGKKRLNQTCLPLGKNDRDLIFNAPDGFCAPR
jgi:hypothetical protein